jgi:hypothetical protein
LLVEETLDRVELEQIVGWPSAADDESMDRESLDHASSRHDAAEE